MVFELCNGQNTVAGIAEKISVELRKPVDEELIWLTIERLKEKDLIEYPSIIQTKFNGLSRREVIRKIGLTSAIGLPIITSMAAPMATNAQSSGGGIGTVFISVKHLVIHLNSGRGATKIGDITPSSDGFPRKMSWLLFVQMQEKK